MKNFRYGVTAILLFANLCSSALANASPVSEEEIVTKQWEFNVALGYAGFSNPLAQRSSAHSYILPQWRFYGEKFYIDNLSLGYALIENKKYYLDIFTYLNDDGMFFNADDHDLTFLDVRKFIPQRFPSSRLVLPEIKRELSYMAGVKGSWDFDWFEGKLSLAQDIAAGHHGKEITVSLLDTLNIDSFNFYVEVGLVYKSKELTNYYYQFTAEEVMSRSINTLTDKWLANPFVKLAGTYQISNKWSAVVAINQAWLHRDIEKSLLVDSREYITGFAGVNYKF